MQIKVIRVTIFSTHFFGGLIHLLPLRVVPAPFTEDSAHEQIIIGVPENLLIIGGGRTTATSTNRVSSLLQVRSDEGAMAIYYGVPCKIVAQVW